jgi:hypothetical protein
MTIRRQLALSYLAIFTLLGLNLLIYFWTDTMRQSAFEDLRRAISRQTLISSVQQQLGDYNKQVTLLVQITGEGGPSAPSKARRTSSTAIWTRLGRRSGKSARLQVRWISRASNLWKKDLAI